ncbi:phage tail tape measure protein [Moraxella lacunata]|uniref:Phage tail tape measure protein n=1 Tax=Moraxella lacunata TaxID=477 RepID=A0A1V4GWK2_MORLA|nr:phage tail tape measure protein [Moraxella lacunata]OPH36506.1 phage tail tape measure protein [Moraxella lacunata]
MAVVSKLQIVLEATTDAFNRSLSGATDKLKIFGDNVKNNAEKLEKFANRNKQTFTKMAQSSAVALAAIGAGVTKSVESAVKFESAMAGVRKVIDFDTPEAFKQMEKDILAMSQRLPMTAEGLANIMASAGQAGIAQADLARFTETAAKMGVAFDITAEQAGQAMAEMRVAFNMSQSEVETLADKINYLGNTSPNNAAKIMQITQAVGAVAELGGFAADQTAALASVIVGIDPSNVATGLKNISLQLTAGENATKSQRVAFEKLGLSAEDVAKKMKEDAVGTLMEITRLISEIIPEHEQSAVSTMLVGREALPVFAQLIQNQEVATQKLTDMGDASKYAGSMLKEFENMAGTSQAQMQLFNNNIEAVKIALGSALLPAINSIMQALTPVIKAFAEWSSENPKIVATIVAVTTAVFGVGLAVGTIGLAIPAVIAGFGLLAGVTAPVWGTVAAVMAIGTALVALALNWEEFNDALGEILYYMVEDVKAKWQAINDAIGGTIYEIVQNAKQKWDEFYTAVGGTTAMIVENAVGKFNELKAKAKSIFDSLPAPVKTALTVIGTVVSTQFALIKNIFTTTFAIIKALVRGDMDGVKKAISDGIKNAWNIVKSGVTNIVGAFKNLGSQLMQAGRDAIQGFINGVKAKMSEALNVARDMANSVASTVKSALNIHSPSRVMRELGAWAGEGFVLGVGDKVGDAKQVAQNLANALTSTVADLHRQNFMLKNHANPLAEWQYKVQFGELAELTDKQKARVLELARANLDLAKSNDINKSISDEIASIDEKLQTHGMNRLEILEWQIANTEKYRGANEELLATLKDQIRVESELNQLFKTREKLKGYQDSLAKNTYLYRTKGDKYAGERWDLSQQGFDGKYIDQMIETLRQSDVMSAMANMPKTLTMPTLQNNNLGSAVSSAVTGYFDLKKQLDDNLAIIKEAENAKLITEQESQLARLEQEKAFHEARQNLVLSGGENVAKSLADSTKSLLGENSKAYRAMFAIEKGFAIARSVMAIQQAIALASANPFPMNLGAMATVASQVASIVGNIKAVQMPVGQAHDGIMSVPKSGTWNLEKGERVLPRHTAQNLDRTLNNLQGRGETKVIINNYTGEKTDVQQMPNGDMMVTIGKMIDNKVNATVNQRFIQARRQGGELYGR